MTEAAANERATPLIAWWVTPVAVVMLLALSVRRAARSRN
jgi:hypothetical protein